MASDSVDHEATSPTLPTSSLTALPSSHSSSNSYTFLIHSDSSQPNHSFDNASSGGDKYAHTRTKRKRTSPEDLAILEAEYQSNPRPEKSLRLEIVNRVSLSEKEVQIWFQNRRQMTRRKCRTWQPNEITSIIRSSQESAGSQPNQNESNEVHSDHSSSQGSQSSVDGSESPLESSFTSTLGVSGAHAPVAVTGQLNDQSQGIISHQKQPTSITKSDVAVDTKTPALRADLSLLSDTSSLASSKDNLPDDVGVKSRDAQDPKPSHVEATTPQKNLKQTSSIRLSMSFDGKAEIRVGDSPSPPQKHLIKSGFSSRPSGLQRSQSEIGPKSQPFSDLDTTSGWQGTRIPGRSRDARTWEFYCDSDARNALTKTAEHEQQGSALGMIGLIRAGSAGRKPLTPLSSKSTNVQIRGSAKRKAQSKHEGKKSKLARTISSAARLETDEADLLRQKSEKDPKGYVQPEIWEDPAGDSDKENWAPGTLQRERRPLARMSTGVRRGILQENTQILSHSSSLGALMDKDSSLLNRQPRLAQESSKKENSEMDEEVSAFIGGTKSTRGNDDLDAVQNLLSLSQGAWH